MKEANARWLALVLVPGLVALSACGSSNKSGSGGGAKSAGSVVIADVESASGSLSTTGLSEQKGVRYAVDTINAAGGISGHKIELRTKNDNSDPATAVSLVRSITSDSSVLALLGPTSSSAMLAAEPLATVAKMPLLGSTNSLSLSSPFNPYFFRTIPNATAQAQGVLNFLAGKGYKKISVIYPNDAFGTSGVAQFKAVAGAAGASIINTEEYPADTTNPAVQIAQAAASKPDAYVLWDGLDTRRLGLVLKTLRAQGITAPVMMSESADAATFPQFAGTAVDGAYYYAPLNTDDPSPGIQADFVSGYTKANGTPPDDNVLLGVVKVEVLAGALKKMFDAGQEPTRAHLLAALNGLSGLETVYGSVTYTSSNHDPLDYKTIQINRFSGTKRVRAS